MKRTGWEVYDSTMKHPFSLGALVGVVLFAIVASTFVYAEWVMRMVDKLQLPFAK